MAQAYRCEFCQTELEDPMLAFLDHIDDSETCRYLWNHWRQNVKREAGST